MIWLEAGFDTQVTAPPFSSSPFISNLIPCSNQHFSLTFASRCPETALIWSEVLGTTILSLLSTTTGTGVYSSGSGWFFVVVTEGSVKISCGFPSLDPLGKWNKLMHIPWKESFAVVPEGLWSRLSRAPVVKSPWRKWTGQTKPISLINSHTGVASWFSSCRILS